MARLPQPIDPNQHQDQDGFDPLPPGWYQARIVESEMHDTKAGTGQYLKLRWEILGPTNAKRVVFQNLNLVNPNPEAVRIAYSMFSTVCRAVGLPNGVQDTNEMHGRPCEIKLTLRAATDNYEASNDVKSARSLNGPNAMGAAPPAGPPQPAYPPGQPGAMGQGHTTYAQPQAAPAQPQQQPWQQGPPQHHQQAPPPQADPWAAQPQR
jgi:hypothetical protein